MEVRNAYKIVVGKPNRKRSLGRPGHRSEDGIKLTLKMGSAYKDLYTTPKNTGNKSYIKRVK